MVDFSQTNTVTCVNPSSDLCISILLSESNVSVCIKTYAGTGETNFSVFVTKLDAQRVHGSKDGGQTLDGVAVDHRLILLHIIPRKAIFMDNPACAHRHYLRGNKLEQKNGLTRPYVPGFHLKKTLLKMKAPHLLLAFLCICV